MYVVCCCLLIVLVLLCGFVWVVFSYIFCSDSYVWEMVVNVVSWDCICISYFGDDDKVMVSFIGGFKFNFVGMVYSLMCVLVNGGLQFGSDIGFFCIYINIVLLVGVFVGSGNGCVVLVMINVILVYWIDFNFSQVGSGGVIWE